MDESVKEHLDAVVDYLLRDHDLLVAREIRQKVEELNQLLVAAGNRKMRVEVSSTDSSATKAGGSPTTQVEVRVYKRID